MCIEVSFIKNCENYEVYSMKSLLKCLNFKNKSLLLLWSFQQIKALWILKLHFFFLTSAYEQPCFSFPFLTRHLCLTFPFYPRQPCNLLFQAQNENHKKFPLGIHIFSCLKRVQRMFKKLIKSPGLSERIKAQHVGSDVMRERKTCDAEIDEMVNQHDKSWNRARKDSNRSWVYRSRVV